jgi:phosphopentomutase
MIYPPERYEVLGNKAAWYEILKELGEEHMRTKKLIVYTSADSVFQIAAHEDVVPVKSCIASVRSRVKC